MAPFVAAPERNRLAHTIETWWPTILVALTERVTNARTEGLLYTRGNVSFHGTYPDMYIPNPLPFLLIDTDVNS